MGQGSEIDREGVNRTHNRCEVDGTRSVNLNQQGIRQVQWSGYVVHPPFDDLVTLMLGEMAGMPAWIIEASAVPLRSKVDRALAVDLSDGPIQSQQFRFGDSSLEVGFENHFGKRCRQGVHNNVARPP